MDGAQYIVHVLHNNILLFTANNLQFARAYLQNHPNKAKSNTHLYVVVVLLFN